MTLPSSSVYSLRPPLGCGRPWAISACTAFSLLLAAGVQGRRVARGMPAQIRHRPPQPLDHRVEDPPQLREVRLLAQHVQKPRDVPGVGNVLGPLDADEPTQGFVSPQFRQGGHEARMPQGDPQQHHAPGDMHGAVVAAAAAMPPQPFEELGIGDRRPGTS